MTLARWDALPDEERAWWVARWESEQARCHECGRPREVCADEHAAWYPQRSVCRATMEQLAARWRYAENHETLAFHDGTFQNWAEKRSEAFPYHFEDGVTIWVAEFDIEPDATWLKPPAPPGVG